ncbi:DNA-3-methyladenine glycosylase 2 family protein [Streptomyces palmae]|uniref:DNA-3-methyladenine glycosylase II n=1 Tax=Streptomyces palmae TaxID=1701085 RepID=A0A4Z0GI74_9ACTN|nr:DNA-3-methyladenine glycosylase 2 family protein [Streptomyces palmae]TGA96438.1 DNA-3-methyladenine glycosylase 2 family protein [Streptomyces palmae]
MDEESRYEAVCSRDARFDGEFFFAVATTGIYCRPSCPAVTPKRQNVRFYPTAAAAQRGGFRACRRCRPDAVPGSAEWNARADVVGRAMRLIGDGVVDREGVAGLAVRLGYSARQVQRQLNAELGAGPVALARAQRAHTARVLLQTTELQVADVAFAAGFASVRQFNDTIREIYAATPSALRDAGRRAGERSGGQGPGGVPLRLAYRGRYAAAELFDFLGCRAVAGVEELAGERGHRVYRRTLRLPRGWGVAEVTEDAGDRGWLACRLWLSELQDLTCATQRLRRLLDLDADPYAVADRLGADPVLGPLVARRPGMRAPGAVDPAELAVRAVLGQGLPVAAARRLGEVLVAAYGEPLPAPQGGLTRLFPAVAVLAQAPLAELEVTEERRAAVRAVSAALAEGSVLLDAGVDREQAERELRALPGVSAWTAGYVRMRALGDPDVLPARDPLVRAGLRALGAAPDAAEGWRPWRSYALHHLWHRDPR